ARGGGGAGARECEGSGVREYECAWQQARGDSGAWGPGGRGHAKGRAVACTHAADTGGRCMRPCLTTARPSPHPASSRDAGHRSIRSTGESRGPGTRRTAGLAEVGVGRQVEETVAGQANQDDGAGAGLAGVLAGLVAGGGDGVVRLGRGDGALAARELDARGERVLLLDG